MKFLKRFNDPLECVISNKFFIVLFVYYAITVVIESTLFALGVDWISDSLIALITLNWLLFCSSMLFFLTHLNFSKVGKTVLIAKTENKSDPEIYEALIEHQKYYNLTPADIKVLNAILEKYPELGL